MPQVDFRARLQPKGFNPMAASDDTLGPNPGGFNNSNLLAPLWSTGGVLFPYTPSISSGYSVEYDPTAFIHSIYGYNAYIRSYPKPISLDAEFTAQTEREALYLLAVIHFFRTVTKSYFGTHPYEKAGTPPPTLIFNYLGDYQFNNVPVIVKDFDYVYEANVDYVAVKTAATQDTSYQSAESRRFSLPAASSDGYTYVPTHMTVRLSLDTQYIPIQLRNEFDLDKFRAGKLMNKGFI